MTSNIRKYSTWTLYRRLLHQAAPYKAHIIGILGLNLIAVPLALLIPLPLKIAVDSVIGSEPLPTGLRDVLPSAWQQSGNGLLLTAVALLLMIALATQLQGMFGYLLSTYTSEKLTLGLRAKLFPHVQRLSPAFHDARGTSDSIYRILYDTAAVPSVVIDGIIPFVTAGLTVIGMIVVTARLSWQLALVALAVSPFLILIVFPFAKRLRAEWEEGKKLASSVQSSLQEVLGAVRVVVAFGKEEREKEKLMMLANRGVRAHVRIAFLKSLMDLLVGMIAATGIAGIIFVGVRQVPDHLTLGEFLVVMTYLTQLYGPIQTIIGKIGDVQASLVSVARALDLLDEVPEILERPGARAISRAQGSVSFCNVSFGYQPDQQVLRNISFEVEPGTRAGLVGATGAGKTTLVNLLTRLYDPTAGEIVLDGLDLRDYRLADLRNQFAIVLQDPVLFSGSVAENIAYGMPSADRDEIRHAARLANADEFITALPDGYDTRVGERGMRMSGGERQRISLARAFLKNAAILILDEPTSSVDMRTERAILQAMERLMEGRTSFLITHRASTLKHCDLIIILEQGELRAVTPADSDVARRALLLEESAPAPRSS